MVSVPVSDIYALLQGEGSGGSEFLLKFALSKFEELFSVRRKMFKKIAKGSRRNLNGHH